MARNEDTVVKYKKWSCKKLCMTIGVLQINNKNRLLEVISTIPVGPDGIDSGSYTAECISRLVTDYMYLLQVIYESVATPSEVKAYQESLFNLVKKVNPLIDPKNIYVSNSNTLTLLKTDNTLLECKAWTRKSEPSEQVIDPYIVYLAIEKGDGYNYKIHACHWKAGDMTLQIREYSKKDRVDLIFGFDPKNTEQKKLYFVSLCVENLSTLLTYIRSRPETMHIPSSQVVNDLYALLTVYNPWIKSLKVSEIRKINKEYVGYGVSNSIGDSTVKQSDSKSYKQLIKVPNKVIQCLPDAIKQEVFGQDAIIDVVCNKIKQAYAGLKSLKSPIGVFLFYGGTSTGKTELAKSISRHLMNSQQHLIKIDCNNLQLDHEVALLMGSPPGYVGYEDGGILAGAMQENGFKVILFDEVEKATPKLFDFVLNIIDEGQAYDKRGNLIDFSNSIIIFTSNIGQKEATDAILNNIGFRSNTDNLCNEAITQKKEFNKILHKKLKPEFFSRLKIHGGVYYFEGLAISDLVKVAEKFLHQSAENLLTTNNIQLNMEEGVPDAIVGRLLAHKPRSHARDVISQVQLDIIAPLTTGILDRNLINNKNTQVITIYREDNGYRVEFPDE